MSALSSGVGCTRFKQNAWKKELCSNCYRPKEEHQPKEEKLKNKLHLPLKAASQGILSIGKKQRKKKAVRFTKEESEIIGYGGVETDSDEDEELEFERSEEPVFEREVAGEDEKALERLTRSNTDFNSVLGNLNGSTETPLKLGAQKKTQVKVTIQPFNSSSSIAASRKSHLNKLLENEDPKPVVCTETKKGKEPTPKIKTIVIDNKKEERGNPEGRKTHITRGSIITKTHEQVKNKLYIQNVQKNSEKRNDKKNEKEDVKTIIITGPNVEEKNAKNIEEKVEPTKVKIESEEVTVKVLKLLNGQNGPPESREMAGEPDGKADSDEPETPITPPPRSSFLHRESPKEPLSPSTPPPSLRQINPSEILEKETPPVPKEDVPCEPVKETQPLPELKLVKESSIPPLPTTPPPLPALQPLQIPTGSPPSTPSSSPGSGPVLSLLQEANRSSKRPAPKPPTPEESPPEPLPRRRGSTDVFGTSTDKKKIKVRQTLRKLLRFGSRDDNISLKPDDEVPVVPRPRPQIIHPLDLNKSAVQVLPPHSCLTEKSSPESSPATVIYSSRLNKPPPPPRSESLNLMERLRPSQDPESVYANLGEGRNGITPVKPQRTGSMRDKASLENDIENVYECIGVGPTSEGLKKVKHEQKINYDDDSDIYYPYVSFQNGECKMQLKRKERSLVHSTLEENYGAVVIANLEALSKVFKQVLKVKQEPVLTTQLSEFTLENFKLTDKKTNINDFSFIDATINDKEVTLALTPTELQIPETLSPLTKFKGSLPNGLNVNNLKECNISVLPRTKVDKLLNYARTMEKTAESVREGVIVLLKIVKFLQKGKSIVNFDNFITYSTSDNFPYPCYIPTKKEENISSQDAIITFVKEILGDLPFGQILVKCNLSDMQDVIQLWLWGPTAMLPISSLKRWLDLERANFLQSLVCSPSSNFTEEQIEQLSFLVHTDAALLAKASNVIHLT